MPLPAELFTAQGMLTLGGATVATVVVCNGLQSALNFNPRWLALGVSQAISFYGVFARYDGTHYFSDGFIALVNGFLIYCTAIGANTVITVPGKRQTPKAGLARGVDDSPFPQPSTESRRFSSPWF